MTEPNRIPTARDIMTRAVITFRPEASIFEAIRVLLTKHISGAPVVDADGIVVGMLSELDCLRVLSSDEISAMTSDAGRGSGDHFDAIEVGLHPAGAPGCGAGAAGKPSQSGDLHLGIPQPHRLICTSIGFC